MEDLSQIWVGGVADSQTRPKTPKIAFFLEAALPEKDRYVQPSSIVKIRETGRGQYVRPGCPSPKVIHRIIYRLLYAFLIVIMN